MTKNEAIKHFGRASAVANALRISRQAVNKWPEELPESVAYKIEMASNGALKTKETLRLLAMINIQNEHGV